MDWTKLKYFKKNEFSEPDKMQESILLLLDNFRDFIQSPLIITSDFRTDDKGQHGGGFAVDVIAYKWNKNLIDLYLAAERFNFQGIGIYPYWRHGNKRTGGLHLDNGGRTEPARWLCMVKNEYIALNYENLKKFNII